MAKIYVVEDDENIRELVLYSLKNNGYESRGFEKSADFFAAWEEEQADLLLLDIMLPQEDGLDILRRLRTDEKSQEIPILMITAKSSEIDKVRALDLGADDYVTKPFGVLELLSRIKAVLRRCQKPEEKNLLLLGSLHMDTQKHRVTCQDHVCDLTFKEFELLKFLLLNRDIVLSRDRIMDQVWGFGFAGESRTVDMHIKTLRQKLGDCGERIKTVRNVGYKISAD